MKITIAFCAALWVAWVVVRPGVAETAVPPDSVGRTAMQNLQGNLSMSVTAGEFGSDPLFSFQLAYFPSRFLGMEATVAHNPSGSTNAVLHHLDAVVPGPRLGRLQPFVTAGLGTIQVFPGTAINAVTVTKLALAAGVGMHLFLREDIALRIEGRSAALIDQQEDHKGTLGFSQWNIGLTFYRSLSRPDYMDTGAKP